MTLTRYKQKRSFEETSEPTGGKPGAKSLRFVVQMHAATHLHYDFRLEMDGVLKSWAIPKGPSMNPRVKRLAVMVEDHPYDYRSFEGVIPEGNYGAGSVIVWDEGTYAATEATYPSKASLERALAGQLRKGKLKFTLHGTKLRGGFALVKSLRMGKNAWLLMKLNDAFATRDDVLLLDRSVKSGKTIDRVGKRKAPTG